MKLIDFLNEKDLFAKNIGCKLVEIRGGYAKATMTVADRHLNAGGVCQGGALFTLADLALAAVMNSRECLTFGIQNNIMYLKSARQGEVLIAEAFEVYDHRRIPAVEVKITNAQGELLCHVTGLAYRKEAELPLDGLM